MHQIIYYFLKRPGTFVEPWFMVLLLSGLPHSLYSILLLPQRFISDTNLLPKTFSDFPSLSCEPHLLPPWCSSDLVYTSSMHSFIIQRRYWLVCAKHYWKKLVGDTHSKINLKAFIKCLKCTRHRVRYWGDIGCSLLRIGSSYFEFKLYHVIWYSLGKARHFLRLVSLVQL